jgi:hypothetical protein
MLRFIVGVIFLVLSFSPSVVADRGEVEYIPARSYFATVQREIEQAKSSYLGVSVSFLLPTERIPIGGFSADRIA